MSKDIPLIEFRPVPDYIKYEVGSDGTIRSIPGAKGKIGAPLSGKPLKKHPNGQGYLNVSLMSDEGKSQTKKVAKIVCLAFHGPKPSSRHHVAHGNGIKTDDRANNLRWATPEENQADRILHNTDRRGSEVHFAKLTEDQIPIIRKLLETHVPYKVIANAFSVDTNAIFSIGKGKTWLHVE